MIGFIASAVLSQVSAVEILNKELFIRCLPYQAEANQTGDLPDVAKILSMATQSSKEIDEENRSRVIAEIAAVLARSGKGSEALKMAKGLKANLNVNWSEIAQAEVGRALAIAGDLPGARQVASTLKGYYHDMVMGQIAIVQVHLGNLEEGLKTALTLKEELCPFRTTCGIAAQLYRDGSPAKAEEVLLRSQAVAARIAKVSKECERLYGPDFLDLLMIQRHLKKADAIAGIIDLDRMPQWVDMEDLWPVAAELAGQKAVAGDRQGADRFIRAASVYERLSNLYVRGLASSGDIEGASKLAEFSAGLSTWSENWATIAEALAEKGDVAGALSAKVKIADKHYQAVAAGALAAAYANKGDRTLAEAQLQEAVAANQPMTPPQIKVHLLKNICIAQHRLGAAAEAQSSLTSLDIWGSFELTLSKPANVAAHQAIGDFKGAALISAVQFHSEIAMAAIQELIQRGDKLAAMEALMRLAWRQAQDPSGFREEALRSVMKLSMKLGDPHSLFAWCTNIEDARSRTYALLGIADVLLDERTPATN